MVLGTYLLSGYLGPQGSASFMMLNMIVRTPTAPPPAVVGFGTGSSPRVSRYMIAMKELWSKNIYVNACTEREIYVYIYIYSCICISYLSGLLAI